MFRFTKLQSISNHGRFLSKRVSFVSNAFCDVMKKYPVEKFYQKKDNLHSPIRIYGMVENSNKIITKAYVIVAHFSGTPLNIIGGYNLKDLEEVDQWSKDQISIIKKMSEYHRNAFLKKDGVAKYIEDNDIMDQHEYGGYI